MAKTQQNHTLHSSNESEYEEEEEEEQLEEEQEEETGKMTTNQVFKN